MAEAGQVALHSAELDKLLLVLDTLPDWDLKQTHTYIYKNVLHVQNPCTYPSPALTTHLHYEADMYIFMPSPSQALTCQLSIITFILSGSHLSAFNYYLFKVPNSFSAQSQHASKYYTKFRRVF